MHAAGLLVCKCKCMIFLMPWTGLFRTLDDAGRNLAKRGRGVVGNIFAGSCAVFVQLFADVSQNQEMLLGWHKPSVSSDRPGCLDTR